MGDQPSLESRLPSWTKSGSLKAAAIVLAILALFSTCCCWAVQGVSGFPLYFEDPVSNVRVNGKECGSDDVMLHVWPLCEAEVKFLDQSGEEQQFTIRPDGGLNDSSIHQIKGGKLYLGDGFELVPGKPVTLPVVKND